MVRCIWVQINLIFGSILAWIYLVYKDISFPTYQNLFIYIFCFGGIISLYGLLKPVIRGWLKVKKELPTLLKIKRKKEVFNTFYEVGEVINEHPKEPIIYVNPNGSHVLTIVTNPSCNPCIELHKELFSLLQNKRNTRVEEIFITETNSTDISYQIALAIISLYRTTEPKDFEKAIQFYFEKYTYDLIGWKIKYGVPFTAAVQDIKILDSCNEWGRNQGIRSTPSIFYNYKPLPGNYKLADLALIID